MTTTEESLRYGSLEPMAAAPEKRPVRRLFRDKSATFGFAVLLVVLLAVAMAPWLTPYDPLKPDFTNQLAPPSAEHPLGTDMLGRDELSRILYGGRYSLGIAVAATGGISMVGLALGLASGFFGRWVDAVIMRLVDVLQALPVLILGLVIVGIFGHGLDKLLITFTLIGWPGYARIVRAMTLSLRERPFLEAARAAGASWFRIMTVHLVPNLMGPLVVLTTLDIGRILLGVSALSFLGFGVALPTPEWGAMLSEARQYFLLAPRLLFYPGIAITVMVLAFNLAGDGLRDILDPRGE